MLSLCPCVGGSINVTSSSRSQLRRSPYKINLQSYRRISPGHSLISSRRKPNSKHAFRLDYSPLKTTAEISTQGPDQGKDRDVVAHAQSTSGLVDEIVAEQASPSPKAFGDELALQSEPSVDSETSESSSTSKVPGYGPFRPLESSPVVDEAWFLLKSSVVSYLGEPVGTLAACDPSDLTPLNYDQVFIRDFIPSAVAFMLGGEAEIVRNFLRYTLQLQSWEKNVDCFTPGEGLMPASFKVRQIPSEDDPSVWDEHLDPDFGESAIGRVAPVDSGLWWIILLRAYGKITGDLSLQQRVEFQTGIKLILKVCLADHFDMFPTLITTDGPCMIDRRLGIHGHPLEIQSLFYGALRAAREMISPENGGSDLIRAVNARLTALSFHIREYYWVDLAKINLIYRYKTEEYSHEAVNKFNIYPEQISPWLVDWMPDSGGYFVGNVQPAHMDFRFFMLGNLWAINCSLASPEQSEAILDLIDAKWDDLIGHMPLKICFPALEGEEWRIITGSDPKNTAWSYHNGGSWPVLLWQFTAACIKMKRPEMAQRAVDVAEKRLKNDRWAEYYDTRSGRFIGKQARLNQTWSISGFLAAKLLLANPQAADMVLMEEDLEIMEAACLLTASPRRKRRRPTAVASPPY